MDGLSAVAARLLPQLDGLLFLLVVAAARAGGLLLALPHMRSEVLPRTAKIVVIFGLSVGLVLASPPAPLLAMAHASPLAVATAGAAEFVFGLGVGFIVQLAVAAARMAGEIAGIDMGFSFSAVADPTSGGQSTVAASLYVQIAIQLFLALGLDHAAIRALAAGLRTAPLGGTPWRPDAWFDLVALGSRTFEAGVRLALPVSAALLALKVGMAMLARVAPRLQIFTLAFALSIVTGLFVLRAALPGIGAALAEELRAFVDLAAAFAAAPR